MASMKMVLSTFTGLGLLDRGFEQAGYCVVSAGDIFWGRDVRNFQPASHIFEGVIGGPPCPDFSKALRTTPTGYGLEMVNQFVRVVIQAAPEWFLIENVPAVPNIIVPGYTAQRLNLNAKECGVKQNRLRCFQFGSCDGAGLVIPRSVKPEFIAPCVMATEGTRTGRRTFADVCELQGLPRDFNLPGLSQAMKYKLVGNGVPVQMACVVATAIAARHVTRGIPVCVCQCGRPVAPGTSQATAACRKRMQRRRDNAGVSGPGIVTPGASH